MERLNKQSKGFKVFILMVLLLFPLGMTEIFANFYPNEVVRIKNKWKGTYLNIEFGEVSATPIENEWHSARWIFEPVPGFSNYYYLKNYWTGTYLQFASTFQLECAPKIEYNFAQMWWVEQVGDYIRMESYFLRLIGYSKYGINNEAECITMVGSYQDDWWSAQWKTERYASNPCVNNQRPDSSCFRFVASADPQFAYGDTQKTLSTYQRIFDYMMWDNLKLLTVSGDLVYEGDDFLDFFYRTFVYDKIIYDYPGTGTLIDCRGNHDIYLSSYSATCKSNGRISRNIATTATDYWESRYEDGQSTLCYVYRMGTPIGDVYFASLGEDDVENKSFLDRLVNQPSNVFNQSYPMIIIKHRQNAYGNPNWINTLDGRNVIALIEGHIHYDCNGYQMNNPGERLIPINQSTGISDLPIVNKWGTKPKSINAAAAHEGVYWVIEVRGDAISGYSVVGTRKCSY